MRRVFCCPNLTLIQNWEAHSKQFGINNVMNTTGACAKTQWDPARTLTCGQSALTKYQTEDVKRFLYTKVLQRPRLSPRPTPAPANGRGSPGQGVVPLAAEALSTMAKPSCTENPRCLGQAKVVPTSME